jgi:YD repeat-containing protein
MRVRVNEKADAVYLTLTDCAIDASEEAAEGIIVDYDAEGRMVGIDILDASKRSADPLALQNFSFELPSVA